MEKAEMRRRAMVERRTGSDWRGSSVGGGGGGGGGGLWEEWRMGVDVFVVHRW